MTATTLISLAALGLMLTACADDATPALNTSGLKLEDASLGQTPNVHRFGKYLLAGQPSAEDFKLAKEQGIKRVINMRHEQEIKDLGEPKLVKSLGMDYVSIPWSAPEEMTDALIEETRKAFSDVDTPTLIHCGSANRVGALWMIWRALDGGLQANEAMEEAKRVGLKSQGYASRALNYIGVNRK